MTNSPARLPALLFTLASLATAPVQAAVGNPADVLMPIPAEAREIFNQSCVMCHGEVIDGKAEIREDLDMSTDEKIRETLMDPQKLRELIETGEMPHKAKLSFRLRKQPPMHERLEALKADYEKNGSKEKLLAWLNAVLPPAPPKEEGAGKKE